MSDRRWDRNGSRNRLLAAAVKAVAAEDPVAGESDEGEGDEGDDPCDGALGGATAHDDRKGAEDAEEFGDDDDGAPEGGDGEGKLCEEHGGV